MTWTKQDHQYTGLDSATISLAYASKKSQRRALIYHLEKVPDDNLPVLDTVLEVQVINDKRVS